MYYLNSFLLYSVIGFLMESAIFKINSIDNYSGFMIGPVTPVYGVGVIIILLVDKYIVNKIKCNKFKKLILRYILFFVLLTIIEFIGGFLLDKLLGIQLWNYTNKKFNIGKYVCLELSFIWGLFGVLFIYIVKPFMDRFVKRIPKKATLFFSFIFIIDLCYVFIKKIIT